MSDITPTWAEVIRRALESRLGDVYTALPGRVETYYPATQTADVTPLVKRPVATADDDTIHEEIPIIPNVPVLFPRGGGFSITWKIQKGDSVQLIFQMQSIAQWRRTGEVSEPGDLRIHHPGTAVAIPGIAPNSDPLDSAQASANALILEGPEIRLGKGATEFLALANLVQAELTSLKNAIIAANAPAGGGPLTGFSYTPGSVAAAKAKGE